MEATAIKIPRFNGDDPATWVFQLKDWDHFVEKLFIHYRARSRDAPDRRLAFFRKLTTVEAYLAWATAIPSWSNMDNLPLPQYWNVHSENTNLSITHKVFMEKPNRENKIVPQYLVEPYECNNNNGVCEVSIEFSYWSKDVIPEPNTTETHLSIDSMYHVAPTDAENDSASAVEKRQG
ncbi:hypothetical protein A4A49_53177 [Nicotiana attenuata]|uniref:Uncharacterized protein n=1 Tax=Nicotiana attenuata TaxID=49451 RepID=A0A314KQ39_NICAT|nr:hypothetical protein A4A49_53177 [Nicotiana attenuata]